VSGGASEPHRFLRSEGEDLKFDGPRRDILIEQIDFIPNISVLYNQFCLLVQFEVDLQTGATTRPVVINVDCDECGKLPCQGIVTLYHEQTRGSAKFGTSSQPLAILTKVVIRSQRRKWRIGWP
jgi:hypothetical protein